MPLFDVEYAYSVDPMEKIDTIRVEARDRDDAWEVAKEILDRTLPEEVTAFNAEQIIAVPEKKEEVANV